CNIITYLRFVYTFINMNTEKMHVIALMDPGAEREKQAMYNIPNYPVMWCMERGKGRVFYDAMGHREDVWDNETFQQIVVAAAGWSMGEGEAAATPNFKDVVPPAEKK
ncbi:MAG: ThuA domain-containing protein, partial [Candidatus Hydrogenedentota bacterium]